MALRDARNCPVTGATPRALERFEQALALYQTARGDPHAPLGDAIAEAPGFAMARFLQAYLLIGGRDPVGAVRAANVLAQVMFPPLNSRERGHYAALAAAVAGEWEAAGELLGSVLEEFPLDAVALQASQTFDYQRGDARALRCRVEAALPAWSPQVPGYHATLAMHAFGLVESGEYERAEETARRALALEPRNNRAHHAVVHVHEMLGRASEGARWMEARAPYWAYGSPMATHQWWHFALFQLGSGNARRALEIFDRHIGAEPDAMSDLIDASALLWRLQLQGAELAGRWHELAERWAPHSEDAYCAFNDLHAMMAFAGAGRWDLARALLAAQARRIVRRGSNRDMTRLVGLPACRALMAYGRGDYRAAEAGLSRLPPRAHRIGGSEAQRNVIELTRQAAAYAAAGESQQAA